MKKLELQEMKKLELDILIYLAQVCEENHLRYFLCGGTMLGAVRHKGFIPWDDDIDVLMPRPDYHKFLQIMKKNNKGYIVCDEQDQDYYYNFAKIVDGRTKLVEHGQMSIEKMGVYVDIFPLDGMPSDTEKQKEHFEKLDSLRTKINQFSFTKPKMCKNVLFYIKKLYVYQHNKKLDLISVQKAYRNLAETYTYDISDFVYATGGAYGAREIFDKNIFSDTVKLEFEGHFFNAPAKFDRYLTQLYGNYMQLPPVEKRVTHHNFDAWYL